MLTKNHVFLPVECTVELIGLCVHAEVYPYLIYSVQNISSERNWSKNSSRVSDLGARLIAGKVRNPIIIGTGLFQFLFLFSCLCYYL